MPVMQGQVGPIAAKVAAGSTQALVTDAFRNLLVQEAGARYSQLVRTGFVFHAINTADVTIGTALTATAVTLTLWNPAASGKNAVILQGSFGITSVTVTAGYVCWAINVANPPVALPTTTTALTIRNNLLGSTNAAVCSAYSAATLAAAPVAARAFGSVMTAVGITAGLFDQVEGALIVTPGTGVTIQGVTVSLVGRGCVTWFEEPV